MCINFVNLNLTQEEMNKNESINNIPFTSLGHNDLDLDRAVRKDFDG